MAIMPIFSDRKKVISLIGDEVEIPALGPFRKGQQFKLSDVKQLNLVNNAGIFKVVLILESGKRIDIDSHFMSKEDFFDIYETLHESTSHRLNLQPIVKGQALENTNKKNKWCLIILLPTILSFLFIFVAVFFKINHSGSTNTGKLAFIGSVLSLMIACLHLRFFPRPKNAISNSESVMYFLMSLVTPAIAMTFLLLLLNMRLDHGKTSLQTSEIKFAYHLKGSNGVSCYRLVHWEKDEFINTSDEGYCVDKYPGFANYDRVEFLVHPGFLGVPWVSDLKKVSQDK